MVMPWLLDTNHWIILLKGRCAPLAERLRSRDPDLVWLCSIVKEELLHGALKYEESAVRLGRLQPVFARHPSAPYDDTAAEAAARVRHNLESQGLMSNTKEFSRVEGLKLEDWTLI
jgi:tRNA(fMet)-specific endonuclease VapC